MRFFVGLHHPYEAHHFQQCFISINALKRRKRDFGANTWILDSGAFTTLLQHGEYPDPPHVYAAHIRRWKQCGTLLAAVTQDYMCEPFVLARTGRDLATHQRLTVERYDALLACAPGVYLMPVLQGYAPSDYVAHIAQYGERLTAQMWVGVGSVCKRNRNPMYVLEVLSAIRAVRPDLRLHGFGIKLTALRNSAVHDYLYSADSMAWSFAARMAGRNSNSRTEAQRFVDTIEAIEPHATQLPLLLNM